MNKGSAYRFGAQALMMMAMLAVGALAEPSDKQDQGGQVLPSDRLVLGVAAEVTAVYNTGGAEPAVPFQILAGGAGDYTVGPETFFYVPVFFADDSPPITVPGPFPKNLDDTRAVAAYLIRAIDSDVDLNDVVATFIEVDGKLTVLRDDYTVGVKTPKLPDGGGTHYIVSAAFLAPLSRGTHTIGIGAVLSDGTQIGPPGYTVTVK